MFSKPIFSGFLAFVMLGIFQFAQAQELASGVADGLQSSNQKVIYFDPEVFPDLEEIVEPTNTAFFSAVSDKLSSLKSAKMIRVESPQEFDKVDPKSIKEFCRNNDADFAIVPKVKYFKVGVGQFVFSNQVVVSMKLFDANGNFISESHYDTYKRNMRLLGSAENSVKIGTNGAIKDILKNIRRQKRSTK